MNFEMVLPTHLAD